MQGIAHEDACENHIIAEINVAHKIDIAVYSITNQKITDAIISAHRRGHHRQFAPTYLGTF